MNNNNSLRSPLAKAKGLGSARSGTAHFLIQRLTALFLIPLGIWFCFSLASMVQMDFSHFVNWLQSPLSASLMVLTLITMFYHSYLGLQMVIEDYVSDHAIRFAAILAVKISCVLLTVIAVVSVLKITTGGV